MTKRISTKALLFALAAAALPAVGAPPDHTIVVSALNGNVHYDHTSGKGLKGFIFVKKKHQIQWSCKTDAGSTCGIIIDFGSASPPCNSPNIPGSTAATTVTCDINYDSINQGCQKSHAGTSCFPYVTKFYKDGSQISLLDDPEFIVDDSKGLVLTSVTTGVFSVISLFALGAAFFVGYRRGKTQTLPPAPLAL